MDKMKYRRIVFAIILYTVLMFLWHIRYGMNLDFDAHAEVALKMHSPDELTEDYRHILAYPLWHILFRVIYAVLGAWDKFIPIQMDKMVLVMAIEESLIHTVTLVLLLFYLWRNDRMKYKPIVYIAVAAGLLFAGPLYIPGGNRVYYLGQLTANPWHNPTVIMAKPFAIGVFYYYIRACNANEKEEVWERKRVHIRRSDIYLAVFACLLAISAFAKPSFYQMFVPGLFLFCVLEVIRTRFRSFWFCFKTGVAIIPTCIIALVQYRVSLSETNRMFVKWGDIWGGITDSILLSIFLSIVFPLFMLVISYKQILTNRKLQLAALAFVSGVFQFALFSFEINWGCDFAWGAYLGTLLLFVAAVELLLEQWHEKGLHWTTIAGTILFSMHVMFGIWYWVQIYLQKTVFI